MNLITSWLSKLTGKYFTIAIIFLVASMTGYQWYLKNKVAKLEDQTNIVNEIRENKNKEIRDLIKENEKLITVREVDDNVTQDIIDLTKEIDAYTEEFESDKEEINTTTILEMIPTIEEKPTITMDVLTKLKDVNTSDIESVCKSMNYVKMDTVEVAYKKKRNERKVYAKRTITKLWKLYKKLRRVK